MFSTSSNRSFSISGSGEKCDWQYKPFLLFPSWILKLMTSGVPASDYLRRFVLQLGHQVSHIVFVWWVGMYLLIKCLGCSKHKRRAHQQYWTKCKEKRWNNFVRQLWFTTPGFRIHDPSKGRKRYPEFKAAMDEMMKRNATKHIVGSSTYTRSNGRSPLKQMLMSMTDKSSNVNWGLDVIIT